MLGVHAKARCWFNAPLNEKGPLPEQEHDDIDAAFEKSFASKPAASVPAAEDPFGLESAFDMAFPPCGGDGGEAGEGDDVG